MGGIPGQEQPSPAELAGHPVLHPDPRRPGNVGDPRAQVRFGQQRLKLSGRDRRAGLPGWDPVGIGGPGGEQPPRRPLTKAEHKHQAIPPGHNMGAITGEVTGEFGVGKHHIHGVGPAGPSDAGL